jgi:hypothetical protein
MCGPASPVRVISVFARIREGLASEADAPKAVMIEANYPKVHRAASSLRSKKGGSKTIAGA